MRKIWILLLLTLLLTGCKTIADIRPDTIVDIPLHPTQAQNLHATQPTEPLTQTPTDQPETLPRPTETEPSTELPTEAEKPGSSSSGGRTGSGTPGKSSGKPKPTDPPIQPTDLSTQPPTQAPTEPPTEAPTAPPAYDPAGYSPGSLDRAVAEAVNAQRQEAGLEPLTLDPRLCAIASVRAWELTLEWSHRRPDGSDGLTVLDQYGYAHSWAGENLQNGGGSGGKIVSRWMSKTTTAGNILSESATVIGVGSYTTADGLTCVAAIFAG